MTFERPTRVIMHFKEDEVFSAQHGSRLVHYQVEIDTSPENYSPDKQFIRFDHGSSEVHGWVNVESVVIDTVLESFSEQKDEWLRAANG